MLVYLISKISLWSLLFAPTQEQFFHVKSFFFSYPMYIIRYICDKMRGDSGLSVFLVLCINSVYFQHLKF